MHIRHRTATGGRYAGNLAQLCVKLAVVAKRGTESQGCKRTPAISEQLEHK